MNKKISLLIILSLFLLVIPLATAYDDYYQYPNFDGSTNDNAWYGNTITTNNGVESLTIYKVGGDDAPQCKLINISSKAVLVTNTYVGDSCSLTYNYQDGSSYYVMSVSPTAQNINYSTAVFNWGAGVDSLSDADFTMVGRVESQNQGGTFVTATSSNNAGFYRIEANVSAPVNVAPVITLTYVNGSTYNTTDTVSILGSVTDTNLATLTINSTDFSNTGTNSSFNFTNNNTLTWSNHTYLINATDVDGLSDTTIVQVIVSDFTTSEVGSGVDYYEYPIFDATVEDVDWYGNNLTINVATGERINITKHSSDDATQCKLFDTSKTLLRTGNYSGDICTLNYTYVNNTNYYVMSTRSINSTISYSTATFNWAGGISSINTSAFTLQNKLISSDSGSTFTGNLNTNNAGFYRIELKYDDGIPDYNNIFLVIGDSIVENDTFFVTATQRFSYLLTQDLINDYGYSGLEEYNMGIQGTCVTNDTLCSTYTPSLIDRYVTDLVAYNPRIAYIVPNINDELLGVTYTKYGDQFEEVLRNVKSLATNSTIVTSTLVTNAAGTYADGTQLTSARMNAEIREASIKNEIPMVELNYALNHNVSLRHDNVHLNIAGNLAVEDAVIDMLVNPNNYVMTKDNFNIYHDCNNEISMFNYSLYGSSMNCAEDTTAEWLVVKNITNSSFTIERADTSFVMSIDNFLTPETLYSFNMSNGTTDLYYSNINGSIQDINFYSTSTTINVSFYEVTSENSILINIYREENGLSIYDNITIVVSGILGDTTYYTSTGTKFIQNLTDGNYTIKFTGSNYSFRSYDITVADRSTQTLNVYLSSNTQEVIFTIVDSLSGSSIEGASVSVARLINSTWTIITTKNSDITGKVQINYVPNIRYRLSVTYAGYTDKVFYLDPILFSTYTVKLVKAVTIDDSPSFQGVDIFYNPHSFYANQSNNLTFTFSSPDGILTSYNLSVVYPNSSFYESGVLATGEIFFNSFNVSDVTFTSSVNITYCYDTTISSNKCFSIKYGLIGYVSEGSFLDNKDNTYGMGLWGRISLSTLIFIIVAGLVTVIGGVLLGGLVGLFLMGFFVAIGFIPVWAILPSMAVGFFLLMGRST